MPRVPLTVDYNPAGARRLRDDFKAAEQSAKKFGIGAEEGLGAASRAARQLREEMEAIEEQRALDKQRRSSKAYVQALKEANAEARKLERATMTTGERAAAFLEGAENIQGFVDLLTTAKDAVVALWEVMKEGRALADLNTTLDRFGNAANAAAVRGQTGNVLSQRQAAQISLRGASRGLSSREVTDLAALAKAAASKRVLTEGGDIAEVTNEIARTLQDEFKTGKIGAAFAELGVSQQQYEQALRREARARGVLPEAVDTLTKREILLTQARKDGARTAAVYRTSMADAGASLEAFLKTFRDKVGEALSGADDGGVGAARGRLSRAQDKFRAADAQLRSGRGNAYAAAQRARDARAEITSAESDLRAAEVARSGALQEQLAKRLVDLAAQRQQIDGTGLEKSRAMSRLLEQHAKAHARIKRLQESGTYSAAEAATQHSEMSGTLSQQLQKHHDLTKAQADQIALQIKADDLAKLSAELKANSLDIERQALKSRVDFLDLELKTNDALTKGQRVAMARELAEKRSRSALAARATDYANLVTLEKDSRAQLIRRLSVEQAVTAENLKYTNLMTQQEEKQLRLKKGLIDLRLEAAKLAGTESEQMDIVLKGVARRAFGSKKKAAPKRGDSGLGDRRRALSERAEVSGLDDYSRRLIEIERQYKTDLKTAGRIKKLADAAAKIRADTLAALERGRAERLGSALAAVASKVVARDVERAEAEAEERKRKAEERAALLDSLVDRTPVEQLENERDKLLEKYKNDKEVELAVTKHYNERIAEAKREARNAELEIDRSFYAALQSETEQFASGFEMRAGSIQESIGDLGTVALGMLETIKEAEKHDNNSAKAVSAVLAGGDKILGAVIKNQRAIAVWKAAMAAANAAMAFATPGGMAQGIGYSIAAVKYAAIAAGNPKGGGGGGSGAGRARGAAARATTSQSRANVPLPRQQGPQTIVNVFVDPLTGDKMVGAVNRSSSRNSTLKFDARAVSGTNARTEL